VRLFADMGDDMGDEVDAAVVALREAVERVGRLV
jgi:hypothetical protein